MNTKHDPVIDNDANNESGRGNRTDTVRSPWTARYLSARLGRLGAWMAACMKAHEDRVLSLRVYSQHRLDDLSPTSARRREHDS